MIRLVNGTNTAASGGRLQVMISGVWQQMTDNGFDNAAAAVVCRLLGFVGGPAAWSRGGVTSATLCARLTGPYHSSCSIDAAALHECSALVGNVDCSGFPVVVTCSTSTSMYASLMGVLFNRSSVPEA